MNAGSRWIDLSAAPARCLGPGGGERGSATRLLVGRLPLPPISLPDVSAATAPGRVVGAGRFRSAVVGRALAEALPAGLLHALRDDFEWYACRGAFFHNDAHYGDVAFGAWCVCGPPREIAFARLGARVPAAPGDWVMFDPFEPHAVLDPGEARYRREHYSAAPPSLFIGFELTLDEATRAQFGIGPAAAGAPLLASSVAVNAETGATR